MGIREEDCASIFVVVCVVFSKGVDVDRCAGVDGGSLGVGVGRRSVAVDSFPSLAAPPLSIGLGFLGEGGGGDKPRYLCRGPHPFYGAV